MGIYIFLFAFGTILGSFLNVVAIRWDKKNFFTGHSRCPRCKKDLKWWELVPLLSFIFLRRKCSHCGKEISWQYPLVEISTALVFLSIYHLGGLTLSSLLLAVIFSLYIVIFIYDLHYKIIPDELVFASIFFSLLIPIFVLHYSLLDWLTGPIIFFFFGGIWLLSKGRAMGFGDAKLGLSLGLLLGASKGFSGIILAFWIGAVASLSMIGAEYIHHLLSGSKIRHTMKSEVPFAPFLILGAWLALIFNLDILHVALF